MESLVVWKCGSLDVNSSGKFGSVEVCKCVSVVVWRFGSVEVYSTVPHYPANFHTSKN